MANETKKPGGAAPAGTPRAAGGPHVRPPRAERRPEMIRQRREERRQVYERRQRQWMFVRIGIIALAVLIIAGIGYGVFTVIRDRQLNVVPEGTRTDFAYAGNDHTADLSEVVVYTETPPVGGRHAPPPFWQDCGYYDKPIRNESAVHSMEHGAVWITYRPDLPQAQIDKLKGLAEGQTYVLVSPYDGLPAPIVASAWNRQLYLDSADDIRLAQFIRSFRQGQNAPEPGAACTGGVDTTIG
jgi:hypothetical protein